MACKSRLTLMMQALPSTRHLLLLTACCLTTLILLSLILRTILIDPIILIEKFALSSTQESKEIISFELSPLSLQDRFLKLHHSIAPTSNPHIKTALSTCNHRPNPVTSHIRLPNEMLNISMIPPGAENDSPPRQYFNPAILPLPPSSRKAPYLLVARLVTEGLHQESHMCLADLCVPQPQDDDEHPTLPADSRFCTPSDLEILGSRGGMRCTMQPVRINIPPTPAKHCAGAWAAFPDIPGFHDPRVFWSGRGEPLIMVNSASVYGCVGLWVMDLRVLFPALDELLAQESGNGRRRTRDLAYRYLTELTRNPRDSRSDVEKNWVMFFPTREESVIMYDLMGKVVEVASETKHSDGIDPRFRDQGELSWKVSNGMNVSKSANSTVADQTGQPSEGQGDDDNEGDFVHEHLRTRHTQSVPASAEDHASQRVVGGRTLALVSSHGFTTHNLTHPDEPPCFDLLSHAHLRDNLNNPGHWHQGSNSLRLVLCTRAQIRDKACLSQVVREEGRDENTNHSPSNMTSKERLLQEGLIVHFSVVHRKFSNEMKLPMRYERYFVVWEARTPWRTVAVSRSPLLFADEWARPWTADENWTHDQENIKPRKAQENDDSSSEQHDQKWAKDDTTYFTYSPSIAWAWRARSDIVLEDSDDDFDDLGTGFLGDDVLVGIGMDDTKQKFAKVKIETLLQCLRLCPGVDTAA